MRGMAGVRQQGQGRVGAGAGPVSPSRGEPTLWGAAGGHKLTPSLCQGSRTKNIHFHELLVVVFHKIQRTPVPDAEASFFQGNHLCHWQQCANNTSHPRILSCFTDIKSSDVSVKRGNMVNLVVQVVPGLISVIAPIAAWHLCATPGPRFSLKVNNLRVVVETNPLGSQKPLAVPPSSPVRFLEEAGEFPLVLIIRDNRDVPGTQLRHPAPYGQVFPSDGIAGH